MQDMQNIPNPDVNSVDIDVDSQKRTDIESVPNEDIGYDSDGRIPVPPDQQQDSVPIEEPPDVDGEAPIDEDRRDDIERIV
jgi:hypothetical protein